MAQPERTTRRGMTFPFFLVLVLFIAVLCDVWIGDAEFIPSLAYRQQPYIAGGLIVVGLLLWLWVLAAARRREMRFDGPVEVARGSNGALQPILATIFIVSLVNLAYSHTIPKWLNAFASERVSTETFVVAGAVDASRRGCLRAPATADRFGAVSLCIPAGLVADVEKESGRRVYVSGPASWFGLDVQRCTLAPVIAPGGTAIETSSPTNAAEILDDIIGSDEPEPPPSTPANRPRTDKLGNSLGSQ